MFRIDHVNSRGYETYTEENGRYYRQQHVYWAKGGYCLPQTRKRISEVEYFRMKKVYEERQEGQA